MILTKKLIMCKESVVLSIFFGIFLLNKNLKKANENLFSFHAFVRNLIDFDAEKIFCLMSLFFHLIYYWLDMS